MVVNLVLDRSGVEECSLRPCVINALRQPEPLEFGDDRFTSYLSHLRRICAEAGLNGSFESRDDRTFLS
jgi:hypothetical protein